MKKTFLLILIILFMGVAFVAIFLLNYKPNNKHIVMTKYVDDSVIRIEEKNRKMEEKIAEQMGFKIENEIQKSN